MTKRVKTYFEEVSSFYDKELMGLPLPNGNERSFKDRFVLCLIAVAWVLEKDGYKVMWYHNDHLPFFAVDQVYYDITIPEGTTDSGNLHHGGANGYRESDLFIIYKTYLSKDYEGTDFINAFSIKNQGAIFPYSPDEE